MSTITLDKIRHRDRVYHLREPITLHVTNDAAGLCVTLYGDEPGSEIRGYAPGHPDREPSNADLAHAVCDFATAFHAAMIAACGMQPLADDDDPQRRKLRSRNAMTRVLSIDTVLHWSEQIIAANRERCGVAAIQGQVPAEESDDDFVEQVTGDGARDRRERAMMRLLRRWLVTAHNYTADEDIDAQVYRFMGRGEAYLVPEAAVEAAIQEEMERDR